MIARIKRWWLRRKLTKAGIDPDRRLSRQELRYMAQRLAKAARRAF